MLGWFELGRTAEASECSRAVGCRLAPIPFWGVVELGGQSFSACFRGEWNQQQAESEGDGSHRDRNS
jgi:hypothetical protein